MTYTNEINELIFFNSFGNGDIHYSREFIKDIIKKLKNKISIKKIKHNYLKNNYKILKDIEDIEEYTNYDLSYLNEFEIFYDEHNKYLYVNTWIGSSNRQFLLNACSLKSNYIKYYKLYKLLSLELNSISDYIPSINWGNIQTKNIDDFFIKNKNKKNVLICNGPVTSGQSTNFDFNIIIKNLQNVVDDVNFILTDNTQRLFLKNVYYTQDIIQSYTFDLNEIAYIGKFSNLIVGRASGPFCFCHNKDNLLDNNKTFISFCHERANGLWANDEELPAQKANQIWSANYDNENIFETILNAIKGATK